MVRDGAWFHHRGDGERPRRVLEDVIERGVAELGEQAELAGLVDGAEEGDDVRVAELLRRIVTVCTQTRCLAG